MLRNILSFFVVITFLFSFTNRVLSQEFNLGVTAGGGSLLNTSEESPLFYTIGGLAEYRPPGSIVSLTIEPTFGITSEEYLATMPLYAKLIFGQYFRIAPSAGVFIRSNSEYGWSAGLHLDYRMRRTLIVFAKSEYFQDYLKTLSPRQNEVIIKGSSIGISLGVKWNIIY